MTSLSAWRSACLRPSGADRGRGDAHLDLLARLRRVARVPGPSAGEGPRLGDLGVLGDLWARKRNSGANHGEIH